MNQERQLEHAQVSTDLQHLPLVLLLDSVELAVNVGSLFRLADALGVAQLHLCGSTPCPPHAKLRRAARATEQVVAWRQAADAVAQAAALRQSGYRLLCLELTDRSQPLERLEVAADEPLCLILGNEQQGVSQALLDLAGESVHLPMQGVNSSMNVAMAAAIACYHIGQLQKRSS